MTTDEHDELERKATRFALWLLGGWIGFVLFCSILFWLDSPPLETRVRYETAINKQAATSLWKWNINSEDAPGHSHR